MMQACATCGELTTGTYCEHHIIKDRRQKFPDRDGYDHTWRKLSERARRRQPFCTDCGTTTDLTTDHTPEAWRRKEAGKAIRLQDVEVVCRSCNSKRGAARGQQTRGDNPRGASALALGAGLLLITPDEKVSVNRGGGADAWS